ncbi:MAG: signal peptidase I [Candidatus Goldiibacteriota bacterium]
MKIDRAGYAAIAASSIIFFLFIIFVIVSGGLETTELIFWGLFAVLCIGELVVVFLFKLPKDNKIRDWVEPAFEAILIAIVIRTFILQAFRIPTSSMEDTLLIGDHILANKFIYGTYIPWEDTTKARFKDPERGDVVIFRYPVNEKLMFIKRCVGLPGEEIEIRDKNVYVNGKKLKEPYKYKKDSLRTFSAYESPRDNFGPVTVPEEHFFVMGDNRDFSADSRFWGFLHRKHLRGKAWVVYWPPTRWKIIKHFKFNSEPVLQP